jgi:hypothetical protein
MRYSCKKGTAGLLEDVESQDCGCGTTDLKMKPTAGTRLGSGSGAFGRQRSALRRPNFEKP